MTAMYDTKGRKAHAEAGVSVHCKQTNKDRCEMLKD